MTPCPLAPARLALIALAGGSVGAVATSLLLPRQRAAGPRRPALHTVPAGPRHTVPAVPASPAGPAGPAVRAVSAVHPVAT